jgi:HSP20 family protein
MSMRDLLHLGKTSVPVARGSNPITAFQDEVNKLFSDFFGDLSFPRWSRDMEKAFAVNTAVDVSENDKEYRISAEIPGMDAKDLQITAADGYITIRGEKREESEEEKKGYFRQERSYGEFQRVIALPDTANLEKAEANMSKGVLTVTIPKKAGAQSKERKIEVKQAA